MPATAVPVIRVRGMAHPVPEPQEDTRVPATMQAQATHVPEHQAIPAIPDQEPPITTTDTHAQATAATATAPAAVPPGPIAEPAAAATPVAAEAAIAADPHAEAAEAVADAIKGTTVPFFSLLFFSPLLILFNKLHSL